MSDLKNNGTGAADNPPPNAPHQKVNDPFDHDPEIAECDRELEEIEQQRLSLKDRGAEVMARKADLMMREQITLRILNDTPLSAGEVAWTTANPEAWAEIKKATHGKRGSRVPQRVSVK